MLAFLFGAGSCPSCSIPIPGPCYCHGKSSACGPKCLCSCSHRWDKAHALGLQLGLAPLAVAIWRISFSFQHQYLWNCHGFLFFSHQKRTLRCTELFRISLLFKNSGLISTLFMHVHQLNLNALKHNHTISIFLWVVLSIFWYALLFPFSFDNIPHFQVKLKCHSSEVNYFDTIYLILLTWCHVYALGRSLGMMSNSGAQMQSPEFELLHLFSIGA